MIVSIMVGDCIEMMRALPAGTFQTCVTSPPYYGLRDYGLDGQIGLEDTPDAYIARMVEVFREVRRVLRDDGTLWCNIGDSYNSTQKGSGGTRSFQGSNAGFLYGSRKFNGGDAKEKDLIGIPWMMAFALRADGWFLRSAIVWAKPNPMPESVRDRPTSAYEMVFLLSKRAAYFYDAEAIAEEATNEAPGNVRAVRAIEGQRGTGENANLRGSLHKIGAREKRNARNVWTIATQPYSGAHFATMPPDLAERCIKAGSKPGDHVLDPFGGAGTTGLVADRLGRHATLCELNADYARLARERITADAPLLAAIA